ncbi:MAG: MSCRAMM family protein [Gammaproteobacteria bacterium]
MSQTDHFKLKPLSIGILLGAVSGLALLPAWAAHPENSLAGSNFEIDTDANLTVDDTAPPSIDWANVTESRKTDTASGSGDDAFGMGSKEDTEPPAVVAGGIPPNKSDLSVFGVFQEGGIGGFLNMFWTRVQDPSGTTNMDFEFNQSSTISSNGVTPVRTEGDLLIQYDLSNGGTNPQLFLSRWRATGAGTLCEAANSTPCWGVKTDLTASALAAGSINTSAISAANSDSLGALSARTFGEAHISLTAIFPSPTQCLTFGSAYLKSRSSDTFSSALKDFIAPLTVNISNCAAINIHKQDDAGTALAGAVFTLFNDNPTLGTFLAPPDTITNPVLSCQTLATGNCTISNVLAGNYCVVETTTPAGHDTAAPQCITLAADVNQSLTFVDPRQTGAILITKTRKHAAAGSGSQPHAGVTFTVGGTSTAATDGNGKVCVDGLLFGSYTVHEITPTGYNGEADKTVTVDNKASCSDSPYVGESVSFVNIPLSDITVSFSSQVTGGTKAKIDCGQAGNPTDLTPSAFDDTSETSTNLVPGTYTCTVEIDP